MVQDSGNSYHHDYDPFGIYNAIQQIIAGQTWWNSVGAKLIGLTVFLVALLPLPLVLLSIVLAFFSGVPIWMKCAVEAFLLYAGFFLVHQFRLFDLRQGASMRATSEQLGRRGSVIVIGAGPVGLAVLKECLAQGLDVQCFERKDRVGGVYSSPNREFPGGCWPTVRLTSSPWVTAYSDFPPDSSSCKHYTTQEYVKYLERYVDYFGLQDHLHFRKTVTTVEPDNDGGWFVTTLDRDTGNTAQHRCERVAICVGLR